MVKVSGERGGRKCNERGIQNVAETRKEISKKEDLWWFADKVTEG